MKKPAIPAIPRKKSVPTKSPGKKRSPVPFAEPTDPPPNGGPGG